MSPLVRPAQDLNWLITNFVERVPSVAHAIVVSSDGLPMAFSHGFPPDRVDQLAAAGLVRREPDPQDRRGVLVTLTPAGRNPAASALSAVARDAIALFTSADVRRLRECASPECGLLFLDVSRPGRRRWCSSNACGGKARAAAYRQRRGRATAE